MLKKNFQFIDFVKKDMLRGFDEKLDLEAKVKHNLRLITLDEM